MLAGEELWWQVVDMPGAISSLETRVRFLVEDVRAAAEWARAELHLAPADRSQPLGPLMHRFRT